MITTQCVTRKQLFGSFAENGLMSCTRQIYVFLALGFLACGKPSTGETDSHPIPGDTAPAATKIKHDPALFHLPTRATTHPATAARPPANQNHQATVVIDASSRIPAQTATTTWQSGYSPSTLAPT